MSTPDHWSAEVLKELQQIRQSISTLDAKITDTKQSLQDEIHSIRAEILEFQLKTQQLDDVTAWANRFREKITLSDVERLKADVDALKEYKAKSTVVFATVQFIMAGIVAWLTKG